MQSLDELSQDIQTQSFYQDLSKLSPPSIDSPLFIAYDINNLVVGQSITYFCDGGMPERWLVAIVAATNTTVNVYIGPEASGVPIRLSGGGVAKLPAFDEYLTLVCVTTGPAYGTVIALRKYPFVDLSLGG